MTKIKLPKPPKGTIPQQPLLNPPKGTIPPQPIITPEYLKDVLGRDKIFPQETLTPQQKRVAYFLEHGKKFIDKPFNPYVDLVYKRYKQGRFKIEDLPPLILPETAYPSMAAAGATINLERKLEAAELPKPPEKDTTTWLPNFLIALDFLGYGIRGGILEAGRPGATLPSVFDKFWKGITLREKPEGWDVVQEAAKRGHDWAKKLTKNKWAMLGVGLALGIFTNPMNFMTIKTKMLTTLARMPDNILEVARMTGKARALSRGLSEADAVLEGLEYVKKVSHTLVAEKVGPELAKKISPKLAPVWKAAKPVEEVRKVIVDTVMFGKNIKIDLPFGAKYLKVFGKEIADVTPIFGAVKTAKDSLVAIVPGATFIQDALGNTFSLYYTSVKYIKDAAKLTRAKRELASGIFAAPYLADEAMTQTLIRMDDITRQFPEEKWTEEALRQVTYSIEDPSAVARASKQLKKYYAEVKRLKQAKGLDPIKQQAEIASLENLIKKTEDEMRRVGGRIVDMSPGQKAMAEELKKVLKETRESMLKAGLKVEFIEDYVHHIFRNPLEEVIEKLQLHGYKIGAKMSARPGFTMIRKLDISLEEATKIGLDPVLDPRIIASTYVSEATFAMAMDKAIGKALLKSNFISDVDIPGWVFLDKAELPSVTKKYMHPEMAKMWMNLLPVIKGDVPSLNLIIRSIAFATAKVKGFVLARPGFHFFNAVGNVLLNFADGVIDPRRYLQAFGVLSESLDEVILNGVPFKAREIKKLFIKEGLFGQGIYRDALHIGGRHISKAAEEKLKMLHASGFDKVKAFAFSPLELSRRVGEWTDTVARMANYIDSLDKGLSPFEAGTRLRKALFDYRELTEAEKRIRRYVIPFYAWTRFSMPKMLEILVNAPGAILSPSIVRKTFIKAHEVKTEDLPQWIEDTQAIPLWVDNKGTIHFLSLNLPYTEFSRLHKIEHFEETFREGLISVNPLFSYFFAAAINRNLLTDRAITKYKDFNTPEKFRDYGRYLWAMLGWSREIAFRLREIEMEEMHKQDVEAGEAKELPPMKRSRLQRMTLGTKVEPARGALGEIYEKRERLMTWKEILEERGKKLPPIEAIPDMPGASTKEIKEALKDIPGGYKRAQEAIKTPPVVVRRAAQLTKVSAGWLPYLTDRMEALSGGNPVALSEAWYNIKTGEMANRQINMYWQQRKGLFLLLPDEFERYKMSGYDNIFDPLANTLAYINMLKARGGVRY